MLALLNDALKISFDQFHGTQGHFFKNLTVTVFIEVRHLANRLLS